MGVYHHADGDEEDGSEDVLDWLDEMFYALCFYRLGKHRAHDEGSKGAAEACLHGEEHHAEAEAYGEDGQGLVVEVLLKLFQEGGDDGDAKDEPHADVEGELAHLPHQFLAFKLVFDSDGREQHHEYHGEEILDDEYAEAYACKAVALKSSLLYGLEDDGGGRHAEHAAEEEGVHGVPA